MSNYNICSDCEVLDGCNVTCSTGNFTDSPSLSKAPSRLTGSRKRSRHSRNAAVNYRNIFEL